MTLVGFALDPSYVHLARLTTVLGVFEHAAEDVPRVEHGYCVDDVARAPDTGALYAIGRTTGTLAGFTNAGQVDGVVGAFRNFELNQMDLVGRPGRAFFPEEEGVPSYDELILVAHRDDLGREALRRGFAVAAGRSFLGGRAPKPIRRRNRGRPEE